MITLKITSLDTLGARLPLDDAVLEGKPGEILEPGRVGLGLVADDVELLLLLLVDAVLVQQLHARHVIN